MLDHPETVGGSHPGERAGAFCLDTTAKLLVRVADMNDHAPEVHLLTLQATFQGHCPGTVISLHRDEDFGPKGKVICSMSSRGPF